MRSGTLPAPLIVGLGEACRLARAEMAEEAKRLADLRDRLLDRLRAAIPGVAVNGSMAARIPGNLNLTFPAATAADLMARVPDLCVSTGSACSSADDRAVLCAARARPVATKRRRAPCASGSDALPRPPISTMRRRRWLRRMRGAGPGIERFAQA